MIIECGPFYLGKSANFGHSYFVKELGLHKLFHFVGYPYFCAFCHVYRSLFLQNLKSVRLSIIINVSSITTNLKVRLFFIIKNEKWQDKFEKAQKHRRKSVDVHCNDAENNQCFCCIFSFCEQQTKTEFVLCETKFPLNFYSVSIILISSFLLFFRVSILLRSAKPLAGKTNVKTAAKRDIITISVYLVCKNTLGIMSCALLVVFNCSLQYCAFIVCIKGQLFKPAYSCLINWQISITVVKQKKMWYNKNGDEKWKR